MGFFTQSNNDEQVINTNDASAGTTQGLFGSLAASYNAQIDTASEYGAATALRKKEEENTQRIRAVGKNPPTSLSAGQDPYGLRQLFQPGYSAGRAGFNDYLDAVQASDKQAANGQLMAAYNDPSGGRDDELKKLQQEHPEAGILTYKDMYDQTLADARNEYREANGQKTLLGHVGSFIGDQAAAFNPVQNPLQFEGAALTAPLGGELVPSIAGRIAAQAGVGGALAGVQDLGEAGRTQERVTGQAPSLASDIAGGAIGGALFQGLGEGAATALRRVRTGHWFDAAPNDPAPPELPQAPTREPVRFADAPQTTQDAIDRSLAELPGYRTSRPMQPRTQLDLEHAATQLADWSGPDPLRIVPPTDTAVGLPREIRPVDIRQSLPSGTETVDQIARRLDPQVFGMYDNVAQLRQSLRDEFGSAADVAERNRVEGGADELQAQISAMQDQLAQTKGRRQQQALQGRIAELEAQRVAPSQSANPQVTEGPFRTAAQIREELQQADVRMRDLAPAVSRAYDRAQGKWASYQTEAAGIRQDVERMLASNDATLPSANPEPQLPSYDEMLQRVSVSTPGDRIPELQQSLSSNPRTTENPSDIALRVGSDQAKFLEAETESLQSRFAQALEPNTANLAERSLERDHVAPDTLSVGGQELHLDRDTITVPNRDGSGSRTVSIRQLLEEAQENHEVLQAVSSCRIG